jgi:hypothetical protein
MCVQTMVSSGGEEEGESEQRKVGGEVVPCATQLAGGDEC